MSQDINPGRLAAAEALLASERGRHLDRELSERAPEGRDRALAWRLALGVTRNRGALDLLISRAAQRPIGRIDPEPRTALRIGLFELRHARTRPHAAVDQAVRLTRALGAGRASGFVNAVLRRSADIPDPTSATVNHPLWLTRRWRSRVGEEATEAWCRRNDSEPPLAVALRPGVAGGEHDPGGEPATAGGEPVPGCRWIRDLRGPVTALPGFDAGAWWVMDPSSAAVVDLLEVQPGERVLDACAAPGGKTLRMAAAGAQVTATDRSAERLELLAGSAERLGLEIPTREVDWAFSPWRAEAQFDAILVDAPCTGLGTVRRHPEIRWLRSATDPAAMALQQAPILANAAACLRPGGRLVYAVCSPEPEEGEQVVQAFLAEHPEFTLERERCFAPPMDDEDAFYAARMSRR